MGSFLREAHTGFHACNGLAFGLAQKVEGFAVGLIRISEFSPESFHDVVVFITNAVPQRIVFPSLLDLVHKHKVKAQIDKLDLLESRNRIITLSLY